MKKFQVVYDENKKLDLMFEKIYKDIDPLMIRKNKLELLVEIGELANETRCFKYWSDKVPNIDKVKDEYADCLIMVLCFFNLLKIKLDEDFPKVDNQYSIVDLFGILYLNCSQFMQFEDKELLKEIWIKFIELGHMLHFTDDEIAKCCLKKINRNYERFEEGF